MDKYFETDDDFLYQYEDDERLEVLYELLNHNKTKDSDFVIDLKESLDKYEKLTGPQYNALVKLYKRIFK